MLQDFQRFRADDVYILCELSISFDSLNSAMLARSDNDVRVAVIGNVDNNEKSTMVGFKLREKEFWHCR